MIGEATFTVAVDEDMSNVDIIQSLVLHQRVVLPATLNTIFLTPGPFHQDQQELTTVHHRLEPAGDFRLEGLIQGSNCNDPSTQILLHALSLTCAVAEQ